MPAPSYNQYLTADLKTCSKCGVTQRQDRLRQAVSLRALVGGTMPGLSKPEGSDRFERDHRLPNDQHTEAELKAQSLAPWTCLDLEACVRARLERERLQTAAEAPLEAVHVGLTELTPARAPPKPTKAQRQAYEAEVLALGRRYDADTILHAARTVLPRRADSLRKKR